MSAQESGSCHHHVSCEGEPHAEGVAAAYRYDQGAEEKEDGDVGAQYVHCAGPTLGARHFRPVTRACESGRSSSRQPCSD